MAYSTKDEVREELQTDATIHPDAMVDGWIAIADALIDKELNTTFETKKPTTDIFTDEEGYSVFLSKRPESEADITSIEIDGIAYTGSKELGEAGKLTIEARLFPYNTMKVTYNYGLASVPKDINRMSVVIAANISRVKDQPAVASIKEGEFSSSFKELNPDIFAQLEKIKEHNKKADVRII